MLTLAVASEAKKAPVGPGATAMKGKTLFRV